MAHPRKNERRLLTDAELEFVEKARHPALADIGDGDLHALVQHLRERRDRALTIANTQRRALRGKGGRGETSFEAADLGNRQKASVLTDALTRARREQVRRQAEAARQELMANAARALELKRAAGEPVRPKSGRRAGGGMRAKETARIDAIGRVGEAGRVTKQVAVAQAKRDAR